MGFRLANVAGRAALVIGDGYYDVGGLSGGRIASDPMSCLVHAAELADLARGLDGVPPTGSLDAVALQAPVPRPAQVFGVGLNYRNHAEESGVPLPELPLVFTKFPSCISAPGVDIELRSNFVDYEGELVAVIGPGGKDIAVDDAWDHVLGLCVGQDVSDRSTQMASVPPQFSLGKSFDTFGPIGPVLVSPDELDDPSAMRLTTELNGEVKQDDMTNDLIFDIPELVSYLSHITTLQTGDLIFTGTPGGVGVASGTFLADGDVIVTTIEGLGTITNRCVRVSDHPKADVVPASWRASWKKTDSDEDTREEE